MLPSFPQLWKTLWKTSEFSGLNFVGTIRYGFLAPSPLDPSKTRYPAVLRDLVQAYLLQRARRWKTAVDRPNQAFQGVPARELFRPALARRCRNRRVPSGP